ncbi:MAG: HesA/MoeB/ThiF family protein [Candidatus Bathyarchaeota archaeon]|nr:MAG: HesA/MoeB/ThiF family protein [Candidatus Bathyarchaeota archaeon]
MVELSKEELQYYSRQIMMEEIGAKGQLKLKNSKVCVVGLGGLGSPVAMQLAGMGVGHLRIVDGDFVDVTNLHRQHLYGVDKKGMSKVDAATERLRKLNPYIVIEPVKTLVNKTNAKEIIQTMNVVVDGLDNMEARYAVNRECVKLGVPYVFGAVATTTGNVSTIVPEKTVCLECFYGNKSKSESEIVGVHPSAVNIIASLEVSETIKLLTGQEPCLVNKLLNFDLNGLEINLVPLSKVDSCPVCGPNS